MEQRVRDHCKVYCSFKFYNTPAGGAVSSLLDILFHAVRLMSCSHCAWRPDATGASSWSSSAVVQVCLSSRTTSSRRGRWSCKSGQCAPGYRTSPTTSLRRRGVNSREKEQRVVRGESGRVHLHAYRWEPCHDKGRPVPWSPAESCSHRARRIDVSGASSSSFTVSVTVVYSHVSCWRSRASTSVVRFRAVRQESPLC